MKWYNNSESNGIVLSTRVRLARNIADYPFSPKLGESLRVQMLKEIRNAFNKFGTDMYNYVDISSKSVIERNSLVEEHLISREFAAMPESEKRMLIYDENGSVSVMAGEEDHIRIQAVRPGLAIDDAFAAASAVDEMLSKGLEFAFDENLGYLTCCPTNTGTGMRISCMLHLPMISRNNYIKAVIEFCSRLGLTVRGFYGEGSEAEGEIYQISNQITLGISEQDTIKRLNEAVSAVVSKEQALRRQLENSPVNVQDKLWRSYGILANARSLSSNEFLSLWSDCMLGKMCGIVDISEEKNLVQLLIECMPAHIILSSTEAADATKRDVIRATKVREFLR